MHWGNKLEHGQTLTLTDIGGEKLHLPLGLNYFDGEVCFLPSVKFLSFDFLRAFVKLQAKSKQREDDSLS